MFEEAEEIAKDIYIHHFDDDVNYPDVLKAITVGVQKGAEHGYNKCKDELEQIRNERNLFQERCEDIEFNYYCDKVDCQFLSRNKWHYVKDGDLPTKELEGKQLLVRVRNYTENFIFAYYMLDLYYSKNGKRFYSDTDCNYPIDIGDITAWKEIDFSEED